MSPASGLPGEVRQTGQATDIPITWTAIKADWFDG
jgi:hypothetical protein